jgi:hypothetical protein
LSKRIRVQILKNHILTNLFSHLSADAFNIAEAIPLIQPLNVAIPETTFPASQNEEQVESLNEIQVVVHSDKNIVSEQQQSQAEQQIPSLSPQPELQTQPEQQMPLQSPHLEQQNTLNNETTSVQESPRPITSKNVDVNQEQPKDTTLTYRPILLSSPSFDHFFLNGKYIINNNQVSAQGEQRSINEELQNKDAVYKRNTSEIPNKHHLIEV